METELSTIISTLSALIGAIVGSLITGYFILKATKNEFHNQKNVLERNELLLHNSILQSIHDEIETIYDRYQKTIGHKIETIGGSEGLQQYYPLESDFFTIYNSNTLQIGKIVDNDLRKQIILTYVLAKGLIDSFKMNNNILYKYEKAHQLFLEYEQTTLKTGNNIHKASSDFYLSQLINYTKSLKKTHNEFTNEVLKLLRMLRKLGVLSENSYPN